jgi:predicted PurR-regulated permease PerM
MGPCECKGGGEVVSARKEVLFWAGLTTFVVVFLLLFSQILFPFIAGIALAYFLNPLVVRASSVGLSRAISATLLLAGFAILLGLLSFLILPIVQKQLASLLLQLPLVVDQVGATLSELVSRDFYALGIANIEVGEEALLGLFPGLSTWLLRSLNSIWQSGSALFNLLGLVVVTPVIAWYLLRDWEKLIAKCDGWLPREYAETIRCQARLIDGVLSNYCRGQASVCLILACAYSIALELVGLNYGLAVGLVSGGIAFIPYLGTLTGFMLAGGLAYVQSGGAEFVGVIAAVFVVGQIFEGYILTPKLVGARIGLSAVWVLFALLAGGSLFGFVGVLLAIPVAAVVGVLTKFVLYRYLGSALYRGFNHNEPRQPR